MRWIVGFGENRDLGGANATEFSFAAALLEVGGKRLVADEKLMI